MIARVEQKQHFANKGHRQRVGWRGPGRVGEVDGCSSRGRTATQEDGGARRRGSTGREEDHDLSQLGNKDGGLKRGKEGWKSQPARGGKRIVFGGDQGGKEALWKNWDVPMIA